MHSTCYGACLSGRKGRCVGRGSTGNEPTPRKQRRFSRAGDRGRGSGGSRHCWRRRSRDRNFGRFVEPAELAHGAASQSRSGLGSVAKQLAFSGVAEQIWRRRIVLPTKWRSTGLTIVAPFLK